jgi:ElaB/YqjD/DUF883 family membrane-anchored ribosome-binding protein
MGVGIQQQGVRSMDIKGPVKDATSTAKQNIDSAAGQLQSVTNEATKQVSAVGGNVQKAIDKSISDQPYATLIMAAAAGFVVGAIWKS